MEPQQPRETGKQQDESVTLLVDDLLEGADAIAEFLFGSPDCRRKVYYFSEGSRLPIFRLGSVLCARKSILLKFITGQEDRVLPPKA
jgi:hypothetical protein